MSEPLDIDDEGDMVTYRCQACAQCNTCPKSSRTNAISLTEAREQEVIEKSVTLDPRKKQVTIKLPLQQNSVDYLTKKHKGTDNL